MTFAQLAEYVASNSRPDGDSVFEIPSVGPWFTTPYGGRLARILRTFTTETPILFASMQAITIPANAREYDLTLGTNSPLQFWEVRRLWVNSQPIAKLDSAARVMQYWTPTGPTGQPTTFAQTTRGKLVFDNLPTIAPTGCYAQGWYRHPSIASDGDTIDVGVEDRLELFDRYAQANLRQYTANSEVGLARLQQVDAAAAEAIRQIKGDAMRALLGTVGLPK